MPALMGVAAACGVTFGATGPAHAQIWSEYAMVSATMGVSDSRVCLGEGSRGDIGCPAYAPYVDAATGYVGIGTNSPLTSLHVSGTSGPTITASSGWLMMFTSPNAPENRRNWAILDANNVGRLTIRARQDDWSWLPLGTNDPSLYIYHENGYVGVGRVSPTTRIDVSGTLRLSSGQETCDANRTGAIKYQSGDFFYCRNGTAWESLTSLSGGGGTAGDRITSGTTGVYTYTNASATIATAGVERIVIGTSGNVGIGQQPDTSNIVGISGSVYIKGTDPLTESHSGQVTIIGNATSGAADTGGGLTLGGHDGSTSTRAWANIQGLKENSTPGNRDSFLRFTTRSQLYGIREKMRITSAGNVGIGIVTPTAKLDVSGTVSANTLSTTLVQIASTTTVTTCNGGSMGALRYNGSSNALEFCNGSGWQSVSSGGGVGIPTGAIAAFASTTCPTGWTEYTAARGRFLRGIDNGAGNDPGGTRAPGNVQTDALKSHLHSVDPPTAATTSVGAHAHSINPPATTTTSTGAHTHSVPSKERGSYASGGGLAGSINNNTYSGWQDDAMTTSSSGNHSHSVDIAAFDSASAGNHTHTLDITAFNSANTGDTETRSKNVAVTFCEYTGAGGVSGGGESSSTIIMAEPAGETGQIQYNSAGSFDASAGLVWDNAQELLTATHISTTSLTVNGVDITGGLGAGSADTLVSSSIEIVVNDTGFVSLSTVSVTWGYFGESASYLPNLSTESVSTSALYVNGVEITATGDDLGNHTASQPLAMNDNPITSATSIQFTESSSLACDASTRDTIKVVGGRIYICRE